MNDFTPPSVRIYRSVMSFLKYALGLIGLIIVATIGAVYWISRLLLPVLILAVLVGIGARMMGWW